MAGAAVDGVPVRLITTRAAVYRIVAPTARKFVGPLVTGQYVIMIRSPQVDDVREVPPPPDVPLSV